MQTFLNKLLELVEQDRKIQEKRIKNGDTFMTLLKKGVGIYM